MLMVILGAGASHDSVHPNNLAGASSLWQPPTADKLFSNPAYWAIAGQFPRVSGLAERLRFLGAQRDASPGFLEREVKNVLEEAVTDRTRRSELVAMQFYLQFLMRSCSEDWVDTYGGLTNHAWLVREIEYWRAAAGFGRVLYATFNYDSILDRALADRFGWDPRDRAGLDGFIADERFALFKLHGSYDWLVGTTLDVTSAQPAEVRHELIQDAGLYSLTGKYTMAGRQGQRHAFRANLDDIVATEAVSTLRAKLPALALPLMDKSDFSCPPSHVEMLAQSIDRVTGVIAIGWRGAEAHFLALLAELPPDTPFFVVSPGSASETAARLAEALPKVRVQPVHLGFSSLRETTGGLDGVLREVVVSTKASGNAFA